MPLDRASTREKEEAPGRVRYTPASPNYECEPADDADV